MRLVLLYVVTFLSVLHLGRQPSATGELSLPPCQLSELHNVSKIFTKVRCVLVGFEKF